MEKQYTIRKIDWNKVNSDKIPLDCIDIMKFFNQALEQKLYPFVPRSEPITENEILNNWVPNKDSTISYVAVDNNSQKVVAGGTLFLNLEKRIGELSITKDLNYLIFGVGTDVTRKVIQDALSQGIKVCVHTSTKNYAMFKVMEKLGYKPNRIIRGYEKYKNKVRAKNFDVYEWIIKPEDVSSKTNRKIY